MKKVAMGLALALAASAFASHPQTINKEGFVGVNKTQSAQSLGHSKLVFTLLGDGTFGNDMFPQNEDTGISLSETFYAGTPYEATKKASVADYIGASAYVGFAIGIWHYFDLGITLPVYYDQMNADDVNGLGAISGTKAGYIGNLKGDLKIRFPLPEDQPFDIAIFGGVSAGTANVTKQGLWVRELEYINTASGVAMPYGTKNTTLKGGAALTMDLGKMDMFPLLIHANGGYRYTMNDDYMSFPFASLAVEMYFMDFLSLFVEYYWDIEQNNFEYNGYEENLELKQLTGALVFHLPIGLDIHAGASYYLGNKDLYLHNVQVLENADRGPDKGGNKVIADRIRVNPEYTVYGGITWSGFLLAQDRDGDGITDDEDKCPDDYGHRLNQGCPLGNPDADEDGVCDAWVAEKGVQYDFAEVCEGIDQCPNQQGTLENNGCPEEDLDPDPDGDGFCDSWVFQKKKQEKYGCKAEIDECPTKSGQTNGCPTKQPDPDGDGLCSPWVTDEGITVPECKGYDMCPGEAGAAANKGCPWEDSDSDDDGMCDPWVTEKKMGYYFEKASEDPTIAKKWSITKPCKGIDKCPSEYGPANNNGCPLGNPDTDGDGFCDAWVAEGGFEEQYEGICQGIDKCPTEKGTEFAQGCPQDNPDGDGDGLCAPWVVEKGQQAQFASICHGVDNCPAEQGPEWNKGCPIDNPDVDGDSVCSPWVMEKGLSQYLTDVCKGVDQCPNEKGVDWNNGCPANDPDPDKDGLCSDWVVEKGLQNQFKGQCHGLDKCPLEPGEEWADGCPAEDPDPDKDGICSPWVKKKNMYEKFKEVCVDYDRCEDEPGPAWNNGCPSDEDPDPDHDGVCSEWVSSKKLLDQFKDVCSGIDACPAEAGDDGHGCPKKAVEKLSGVTFKSGKATLEANAKMILKGVAEKLKTDEYKDYNIVIQGHTDNKGKAAANEKLSKQRAESVMKELTKAGVDKKRIKAIGLGPNCPVEDNDTEEGREMNRRIEMHYVTPDDDGMGCHN